MDGSPGARAPYPRGLATTLALLGLVVSGVLQVLHVRTYLLPDAASVCSVGETFDCNAVTLSRFSVVLGVPLPAWGALGFYAMAVLAWRGSALLLPFAGFAAAASIALLLEELLHVGAVCMFCEGVHAIAVALFAVAWWARKRARPPTRADWASGVAVPAVLWLGVRMFAPVYWSSVMWTRSLPLAHGLDEAGDPWIGAESPVVTVHEYTDYSCPHCRVATSRMLRKVSAHSAELRVVRHQQPRLRCVEDAMSGCQMVRVALCGGDQGKFWETDSWLFAHGSGERSVDVDAAAADIGLDAAALHACVDDVETQRRAGALAKAARALGIKGTPGYIVDGEVVAVEEIDALIDGRL
jgi:uncharacterized membrane protein